MKCLACGNSETKVIDSRTTEENLTIRRRRECEYCGHRFTTFERTDVSDFIVIKKDGSKQYYDREKLKRNILLSVGKRPVELDVIDAMLTKLEITRYSSGKEISSRQIGDDVLEQLKDIDEVAYVRFGSVYKEFDGIQDFQQFMGCKVE